MAPDASADLAVRGGQVFHDGALAPLTLGVTDGRVSHLLAPDVDLPADETLELDGEPVLPGFVDGHVHLREPGYVEKEGVASGTAAAAAGGVTTVVDMPNTDPPTLDADAFAAKAERFDAAAHVDFALHGAITGENVGTGAVAAMADAGATSFKAFMATSFGPLLLDDLGDLHAAFEAVAGTGRPLYVHAESEALVEAAGERARAEHGDTMAAVFASRPALAEVVAVGDVLDVVAETGAEAVVAHVTTAEALDRIADARTAGVPVHAEVTPFHLAFAQEDVEALGTVGVCNPPARPRPAPDRLWAGLAHGDVHLLGTDHAPHLAEEKERSPLEAAPGMPQLDTALPYLLASVDEGRLTVAELVACYAAAPARVHGLYPRKGSLRVGADADLVVVDPDERWTVDPADFASKGAYSPWAGESLVARPRYTYLRGERVAASGDVVGEAGLGRLQTRD